jgi:small subunit ribosomal protein S2
MKEMPGALVIVDPKEEETAVMEAKKMKIPVVAVLNTDCDPEVVEYPVPANDATVSSIEYLFAKLGAAVSDGLKEKGKIESASAKETQKGNGAVSAAATKYAK